MFYIITYVTHSEKYFDLLKTYPNLVILGYGTKWTGFHDKVEGVVSFCKKIKSDDIVCFVDGFDTLILESSSEILKRYKELNKNLIFSKAKNNGGKFLIKWTGDKLFGTCKNQNLNTGMYIGKAQSIMDIWRGFKKNMDDQRYITQKCIDGNDIYVDKNNYLFYNYSPYDKDVTVEKNKLYINSNKFNTCIISSPGNNDIKHILQQLKFNNIPSVSRRSIDTIRRIRTYAANYIPEFILMLLLVLVFYNIGYHKFLSYFIAVFLIISFLEFSLKTQLLNISNSKKLLYTINDVFHNFIAFSPYYIALLLTCDIFKQKCNFKMLLILNIYFFIIFGFFIVFKRCILSIWAEKLTNSQHMYTTAVERLHYFFNNKPYLSETTRKKFTLTLSWINAQTRFVLFLLLFNLYFLIMFHFKKCKLN